MHELITSWVTSVGRRIRFARYSLRAIGARELLGSVLALASDPDARTHDSGFDRRYGTDTTIGVTPGEAGLPAARVAGATAYLPTMDVDLSAMLDALAWPESMLAHTTFVDIGSGKGRVVLLAAMRRFREVVGVELSPSLHAIAQRNVAIVARGQVLRSPVRLVVKDATALVLPEGPLVLYLYHPFGADVASAFVDRVVAAAQTSPRPIAIVYGHPLMQQRLDPVVFLRGGVFRCASEGARATRHFRIGWSIYTNHEWLALADVRAA